MPSQLTGLFRTLAWSDFKTVTKPKPGAGQTADAAATKVDIDPGAFGLGAVPGTKPPQLKLNDAMTVKITFNADASWKSDWISSMSQADQDRLLKHEQGHYNIAGLIARDFFLALMQLKAKTYKSSGEAQLDLNTLKANILAKSQPAQDRYDDDTKHGTVQSAQDSWNGFIDTAFTQPRSPPEQAIDGTVLKTPLLDVLAAAQITI